MRKNREKDVLNILQDKEEVTVEEIAKALFISPATVRRTLAVLSNKGLVVRTHGGAKLEDANNFTPSFDLRTHTNRVAKKQIALASIKLVKNGDMIFLDGSTSAYVIAEHLKNLTDVKVVTNGIDTLTLLAKNGVKGYSTGGVISAQNPSALIGGLAEDTVTKMHANVMFFSCQAVDKQGNVYDCYEEENYLRQAMMKNADVKVLLCDGEKIGKTAPYKLCTLYDVDFIVSDANLVSFFDGRYIDKTIIV